MSDRPEQASQRNRWGPLRPLGEALRFLTIIPIVGMPPMSERGIARAIALFPLAGAVIGALLAGLGLATGALWDAWVRSVAIVVGWAIVTSGLHLDGLSDTFDAVMSWRPRERKLEIMKDSRIGAMGAIALALDRAWIDIAQVELTTATDAAALAAARELACDDLLIPGSDVATRVSAARGAAIRVAALTSSPKWPKI